VILLNLSIDFLKNKASNLTSLPGVYLMKDSDGNIIYVGKAKNLNNRVTSYFLNTYHQPKVELMIENVYDFDFIVTKSEYEALILECNLIKQYTPQYNILLMDDKSYTYIFVPQTDFPRLSLKKNKYEKGKYFGPYISSAYANMLLNESIDIFKLPTCNKNFNKKQFKPCLRYHINKCLGYCCNTKAAKAYRSIIDDLLIFLESGYKSTIDKLSIEMQNYAKNLNFEKAIYIRDRLKTIDKMQQNQIVINNYYENCDVVAYAESTEEVCVSIIIYRNGNVYDKASYFFSLDCLNEESWEVFFAQHYINYHNIPDRIILSLDMKFDLDLLLDFIEKQFDKKVKITYANSGLSKQLYEMSLRNAFEQINLHQSENKKYQNILNGLSEILKLKIKPNYIEAYDISNLSDTTIVAGMVVFENGIPLKNAYKHFNLNNNHGQDDLLCMYKVLLRRLKHINNDSKNVYFNKKPDLLLIDGGLNHIKYVYKAMMKVHIDIPVFGMVKDLNHRTRCLIGLNGKEYNISSDENVFNFITAIQDEVHRYSVAYMHSKNNKLFNSSLLKIRGIGKVKLSVLMDKYTSIESLKTASKSELLSLLSVSESVADDLIEQIKKL
jgi:excinuclease ABC subunit C